MAVCTTTTTTIADKDKDMDTTMDSLLASFLHNPALLEKFHIPRFRLRLATIAAWGVKKGERLLDIGCGQGESSVALAAVVGAGGSVTAIDTARMDYGEPFTMREAHAHIQKSALGARISFYPVDASSFLTRIWKKPGSGSGGGDGPIDAAVLCQCLFYFPDASSVRSLFAALSSAGIPRVYAAEWSYAPSHAPQRAHILATRAQALYHMHDARRPVGDPVEQNVRAAVDQQAVLRAAARAGYRVSGETLLTPERDMREGQFEVDYVLGPRFRQRVKGASLTRAQEAEIRDAVQELKLELEKPLYSGTTSVMAMDVWCAVFELQKSD
ncbi:hypothetical protein ARSEF4850_006351 [Beauveria asiatica]